MTNQKIITDFKIENCFKLLAANAKLQQRQNFVNKRFTAKAVQR